MTRPRCAVALVGAVSLWAAVAPAQAGRHELGLRLRAFERRLAEVADPARRDGAFVQLERAVQAFFRMDTARVAASIDAAELALGGREAAATERFARSLALRLHRRLVDNDAEVLEADVHAVYELEGQQRSTSELTVLVQPHGAAAWQRVALDVAMQGFEVDVSGLPAGDHTLRWRVERTGEALSTRALALAAAPQLRARLERVYSAAKAARKAAPRTVESATLPALANLLRTTQRRNAYETELNGLALLEEAEGLAAWLEGRREAVRYGGRRAGSFRLHVPVGGRVVATRLDVPAVDEGARPLVVALHGAGGSENLFFDGYGDGLCVALARARGWFVASPRVSLGGVDCAGLVDALAARFPVDTDRVFVVGHSMGAAQLMANVARTPGRFRAAAPVAGGGRPGSGDDFAAVPFFVAAGARDFGRSGARRLHTGIEAAGARAVWRLYPSVEHLAVMQIALPDVFAFFDEHAR